jgi:protein tyrosine phosphatase (PTP) superfamily phosphohydrolase (DUF442 family)
MAGAFALAWGTAGCDPFGVDVLHWLAGYNLYAVAEGRAYRSRQPDAALLDYAARTLGVRTVVNLRGENPGQEWYDTEVAVTHDLGVQLIDIPMSAGEPPSPQLLLELYETFLTVEHPILIHCLAGADRAGAASAIWRMTVAGDRREDALDELDRRYGHFKEFTPAMDWLAEVFVPDANWITTQYDPNAFQDLPLF